MLAVSGLLCWGGNPSQLRVQSGTLVYSPGKPKVASIQDGVDNPHQRTLVQLHVSRVSRGVVKTTSDKK